MELIIGFVIAIILALLAAESETLADAAERRHINYMADRSRRRPPQAVRSRCRYIQAGYRPGKTRRAL